MTIDNQVVNILTARYSTIREYKSIRVYFGKQNHPGN